VFDQCVHRVKDEHKIAEGEKWTLDSVLSYVEGADSTLALAPLLPNLGKASAKFEPILDGYHGA
jgi:hypothetical protein